MMIDNSEGPGGFAQIGYAKSAHDWGDNRVYYFYEYEPAGQIVNGAVKISVMPANYTGYYNRYAVYLNNTDGKIHFVLNGSAKAMRDPNWTSDRGSWCGETR